jgi:hypothetical protein
VAADAREALESLALPHGVSCPPVDEAALIAVMHTACRLGAPLHSPVAAAAALAAVLDAPQRFPPAARVAAAHALPSCGADALWAAAPGVVIPALLRAAKDRRQPAEVRIAALHAALWLRPSDLEEDVSSLLPDVASIANERGEGSSRAVAAAASRAQRAMLLLLTAA